ncbi:MAG: 4a-hydroxytetrahydrobiopterin dehydratase [Acidobacteria bacterium]|nr:MAG: 4a-hydroxytetrahydrobiopterin dehydratase [Acidobacteriota bacterium]
MGKFSGEEIVERLKSLAGWKLQGKSIRKEYELPSFVDAIRFVNKVADLAEEADHHPDILINYRRVILTLSTHSEDGITQKDFDLAKKIDQEGKLHG